MAGLYFDYVIAGASCSGLNCAKTIREYDSEGSILIVSRETMLPYKRTKLSKKLFSSYSDDDFLLFPREWYAENRITLYLEAPAADLAPEINTLFLADGRKIGFGKLCIATGARPLPLPHLMDTPVYYLREKLEGQKLYNLAAPWKKVLVAGNGIQGVEMAEQFRKMGKAVDISGKSPRVLSGSCDSTMAEMIRNALHEGGIYFVDAADLSPEQISTGYDAVVASIGIAPDTSWLSTSGLNIKKGIVIDRSCRTSHPDIWAAGDVTEPLYPFTWGMWHGAEYQGQCAGKAMAGEEVSMELPPFRLKLDIYGRHFYSLWYSPDLEDDPEVESEVLEPGENIDYCRFLSKKGTVAAVQFSGAEFIGKKIISPMMREKQPLDAIVQAVLKAKEQRE